MNENEHTPADAIRERYEKIVHICDGTYLAPLQKKTITDAFLDTAHDYAYARAEADAWRERFKRLEEAFHIKPVELSEDELRDRANAFLPTDLEAR